MPFVWANVIRIDRLSDWKEEGRLEIIRRTRGTPLCVKGNIIDNPSTFPFSTQFIELQWARIRKLDLRIYADYYSRSLWMELFARPAPYLESFKAVVKTNWYPVIFPAGRYIFDGAAPSLRTLHTTNIAFKLTAPWKSQLRRLRLDSLQHTADDMMEAIRSMPLLEHLDLQVDAIPPIPFPDEMSIKLPNLTFLRLSHNFRANLIFAHAIDPSESCRLIWIDQGGGMFGDIQQDSLQAIFNVLSRYSRTYSLAGRTSFSTLHGNSEAFRFRGSLAHSHRLHLDVRPFYIDIVVEFPKGSLPLCFFSTPSSGLVFASVKNLDFRLESGPSLLGRWTGVSTFLKTFPSVVTLNISSGVLDDLIFSSPPNEGLIFPLLQELSVHFKLSPDRKKVSSLHSFLEFRKDLGHPIAELCLAGKQLSDWSLLEGIHGLKVVWEKGGTKYEYTCGNGRPERLNFWVGVFVQVPG
ncbi:hypothetical protein CPB84DRAFT_1778747 [Gymnopilus junonius]|uniref:F-box domain-containing protein n=1 Tax=Gymnopilus junonius TaxID=109634 RepID=A0A9P5NMX1_GYMJU|nr:hypothetical protein CPB84DRAFT_1778747 [Gymnopilus junonius]